MGTNQLGGGLVTNGEQPLSPNLPELIQRNLSTLKHHLRHVNDELDGWYHRKEAARLIREHNRLVRENRKVIACR